MFVEFKEFMDAYGNYGIQGMFTAGLLFILWQIVRWAKPKAEELVNGHLLLMRTMRVSLRKLVVAAEHQTKINKELVTSHHELHQQILNSNREIRQDILRVSEQIYSHHNFGIHLAEELKLQRVVDAAKANQQTPTESEH